MCGTTVELLPMDQNKLKWLYLLVLSLVWGSSFILMKKALIGLTAPEMGALRILISAMFLFVIGCKSLKKIAAADWKWIVITAFLGTFFPVFLFAFAETQIDSAIVSILNSSTPLLTLLFGIFLFGMGVIRNQILGVILGLLGTFGLIVLGATINPDQNYFYAGLVLLATLGYAINVNIIKRNLQHVSAMAITTGNFLIIVFPTMCILLYTGYLQKPIVSDPILLQSLGYVTILAVLGTALAKIIFNKLVQISNPVFSSSVTYVIPVVALTWGLLDGEKFHWLQGIATLLILLGVFLVNGSKKNKREDF